MEECNIEAHEFEKSKNQLKVFSEQTLKELKLRKVDVDGWFLGLGDHKVTGYELNRLTNEIQNYLIKFNSLNIKFIEEFGQVYNALEALDKDYIQAILMSIKSAEKANKEAKIAQGDIKKTIEIQKKTIASLNQFKNKIESYEHLKEVDNIWIKCEQNKIDIMESKDIIETHEKEIENLKNCLQKIQKQSYEKNKVSFKKLKVVYTLLGIVIGILSGAIIFYMVGII